MLADWDISRGIGRRRHGLERRAGGSQGNHLLRARTTQGLGGGGHGRTGGDHVVDGEDPQPGTDADLETRPHNPFGTR